MESCQTPLPFGLTNAVGAVCGLIFALPDSTMDRSGLPRLLL